jgi:hypothetical protein
VDGCGKITPVTVREHIYPVPDEASLAQMVGAATPHFALQIRDRVVAFARSLPEDHPRQAELTAHVARLEALALGGEAGHAGQAELPTRPSLVIESPVARGDGLQGGAHDA